jgi:hypothetical protein
MPAGMTPFGVGAHQSQGTPIDPLTLGPFVYLNSLLGLALADGAPVATWPDQSGNGHNGTQGDANQQPTYRSSGIHTSANGSPLVAFDGLSAPFGDNIGGTLVANPSVASGYDLLAYGRFNPAINAFACSVFFQDNLGAAPQVGYEDAGARKWFERDAAGTSVGDLFGPGYYGSMRWRFVPATATTGTVTAFAQGVQVFTKAYNFDPTLSSGWGLGANQVDNCAALMDLGAFVWYTKVLTDRQAAGVFRFFRGRFG